MAEIKQSDIEHVAELARLKLTEAEIQEFTHELGDILSYVDEINQTRTSEVRVVSQISGLSNIVRQDEIKNENNREELLKNVPEQKDGFIVVKKIFD